MRTRALLIALGCVALSPAQAPNPLFPPVDRDKVHAFWSEPTRYAVNTPVDHRTKGLWQVRLTVEGSTWLWNYNRGRKVFVPPTQDAPAVSEDQKLWNKWIDAKIAYDRWEAWHNAREANWDTLGIEAPDADASTPSVEPTEPGPIPPGLLDSAGSPPRFAAAVVPMEHTIDFGDVKLVYRDHIRPSSPKYAYFRFDQGVMSGGTAVKNLPSDKLDSLFKIAAVNESEAKVMRAVSILEGGFDSINTYDTGFVSVGFIQFACLQAGAGSLGKMMQQYKADDRPGFDRDFHAFGVDVTDDGKLCVLDLDTQAEVTGPEAMKRIIEDKRLIAVFQRAGKLSDTFCAAQIKTAKSQYWPGDDIVTVQWDGATLSGKVSDVIKSEAGLATLFDRKVNTGKIDILADTLGKLAPMVKPTAIADFAAVERQIVEAIRYRKNYLDDSGLTQPGPGKPLFSRAARGSTSSVSSRGSATRGGRKRKSH